jgi:predicted membrane channel-forming protein YqfA (hemolysin III family)
MVRSHKKSATAQLWRHCKSSIFPAPRDSLLLLLLLPTSEKLEVWVLLWIQRRASIFFFMLFFCWSKRWEVEALRVLKRFDKERILVLILSSFLPFFLAGTWGTIFSLVTSLRNLEIWHSLQDCEWLNPLDL